MRGFFEHEYLDFKKSHLSNLISLAKIDGDFHKSEEQLIFKIGEKYRLKKWQVEAMIEQKDSIAINIPGSHVQKMGQLYDLLRMIYADNVIEDNEVSFCKKIAEQFGYKAEIVDWLIRLFANGKLPEGTEWDGIVNEAEERYTL